MPHLRRSSANKADALIVAADPFLFSRRLQLATLATRHALPAIYPVREYAEVGGLITYGTSLTEVYRQAGASSGAPSRLTCRLYNRASSSWSSMPRPPGRWASKSPTTCSRSPTR